MTGVEDSIVEMKFDNAKFEQKLGDTIKSLDKLRASLDMAGATKGLEKVGDATKHFQFTGIHQGLEDVSRGFLAMSTIAITAISQITMAAFSAGAQIVKAFTISPIVDGFQEMETNMNSIQTILANTKSKGSNLDDVNKALQDLNEYSDKTIYNFSQMAKNIGTFTAAGIGLDQSTAAIKGIANLAAVSGSSADQASGAMYQLSQALATGTLKLIDWNSVVNSGMGGEVFKTALFETGKAMGTIKDVDMGTTFKEWEKNGNNFRESLQDGWITAEVLTKTLQGFTGDYTDAQLKAMGFHDEQIKQIQEMGDLATAAATEVKTFTQLMSTVKEAVGTTWADTFRLVIGDFGEAKQLFTGMYAAIAGFIDRGADVRNKMLAEWKFMGGRNILIQGFKDALKGLGYVIKPIKEAFRSIFPKNTSLDLIAMTKRFGELALQFRNMAVKWAPHLRKIFAGLFAGLEIGWTIVKNIAAMFVNLGKALFGVAGGPAVGFLEKLSGGLVKLNQELVAGGGIKKFFDDLTRFIIQPLGYIRDFTDAVISFFKALRGGEGSEQAIENTVGRFEHLHSAFKKIGEIWAWLAEKTRGVRQALGDLWNYIMQFFRELGDSMKAEMNQGDFEGALDIFNVAFLGGIALLLRKFLKNGLKLDFGGGLMEKISGMFDQLTGVLKAMQLELKAKALLKIAAAVGILTISIIALSLIDSAALAKALTAISVGFGELIAAMALMDKVTNTMGSFKIGILAGAMILLAGSMVVLAAAIKILSSLSWSEIAKGLVGVGGGLTAMVTAMNMITSDTSGLIRAGVAMIAIALGLRILANAMQAFATMDWGEILKGFVGVAAGLTTMVTAMNFMPTAGMIQAGIGIIAIAVGMRIMANAMQAFATMDWGEIAKGLTAVGVALGIIVVLTNTMPAGGMVGIGVGLIGVAIALRIIAEAVEALGKLKLGTLVKGLAGLGAVLLMVALATNAMNGALSGAAAMVVVAGALVILTHVLKEIAGLGLKNLLIGLVGMAAVFAILGGAAYILQPLIPTMLGLGAALALVGGAFALFGVGAYLTIKAFELLGKVGKKSMLVLMELIAIFMARAPLIGIAIASVIVSAATDLAEAAPALIKALKVVILELLEAIREIAPDFAKTIGVIITEGLKLIREKYPDIQEAGYDLFIRFLAGIRDNIKQITGIVINIIINFVDAIAANADRLVESGLNLIQSFLNALSSRMTEIVGMGIKFVMSIVAGIAQNIGQVITMATNIVIQFLAGITQNAILIVQAGANLLISFLAGITNNLIRVANAVTAMIQIFIITMGNNATKIAETGANVLVKFLKGITDNIIKVTNTVGTMITRFIGAVGENTKKIMKAGTDAVIDFLDGVQDNSDRVMRKFAETGLHIMESLADTIVFTVDKAGDILLEFLRNLRKAIDEKAGPIGSAGRKLAGAIINGMTGGLAAKAGDVADKLKDIAGSALDGVKGFFGISSPSKVMMEVGRNIMAGLVVAFRKDTATARNAVALAGRVRDSLQSAFDRMPTYAPAIDDTDPVITPVIDLSKVRRASQDLDNMMKVSTIRPDISIDRARALAVATNSQNGSDNTPVQPVVRDIKFEQNIYAPEALSSAEVYRQTKSQIALAKEELDVA